MQVHIVQKLAPGGIEHLVLKLAETPGVQIFSLEGTAADLLQAWPSARAVESRLTAFEKAPGLDPRLPVRLAGQLRTVGATSVVSHHAGPLLYGGAAARLAGVRSYTHVEHDAWHLKSWRRRQATVLALRTYRPDRVAVSSSVAMAAAQATGLGFRVIRNGVDCDTFRPGCKMSARHRLGLPADRRIVGGLGRLERVKGFDRLIEAARFLPPDILVVIWGDGSERGRLAARIEALGLGDRVRLAGHADHAAAIYPALDLLCLPSRHEGLPLSILEAQACGIPVLASDVGGVRDGLCPASSLAVRIADGDPEAFARTLAGAFERLSGGNPRRFIRSNLSLTETRQAYLALEPCHA